MYFDTHAHYDASWFDSDRDALLAALPQFGIGLILNPGCDLASSRTAVELAERYAHVYAAVGFHPSDADAFTEDSLDQLRQLARHPKVRAIGEIGLDYYWTDYAGHDRQKEVLRQQLALAQELDLPVIFHDREAHGDSLAVVKEFPGVRGVFHCYSGSLEDARVLVDRGWMLSFTGNITFKNAPYMLPYPRVKGEKRNDSSRLPRIAAKIAAIRGLTEAEVERISTENGIRFFGLEDACPAP